MTEDIKTEIQNASREQLVLMLYDGALKYCQDGKEAMARKDKEAAHQHLTKAQNIVMELLYALDRKKAGEIGDNLASLYTYSYNRLVEANVYQEPQRIDDAMSVLKGLRSAWEQAMKLKESKTDDK